MDDTLTFILEEDDIPYEEDVLANRWNYKSWWRYLQHKKGSPSSVRNMIYERALRELPDSYKLWYNYLSERKAQLVDVRLDSVKYGFLEDTFQRAMAYMHKYPRIWMEYLTFLTSQHKYTATRKAFDKALQSLPITQHERIWPMYIKFVRHINVPETAIRVYRRYLKLEPNRVEDFIDYLIEIGQIDEAVNQLAKVINIPHFVSIQGKSKHELWMRLCDLASKNPLKVTTIKVEPMIRSALEKFTNEIGHLWVALGDYFVRVGNFEKARDVFEEGVNKVMTIRDFSQVWDAYIEFEYGVISRRMEEMAAKEDQGKKISDEEQEEFDFQMARYEDLIERQAVLISNVLLRQNPNNVLEWHKRIMLFKSNAKQMIAEYYRAISTIDPLKASGKLHTLWISFARFWEDKGKMDEARKVFEKGCQVNFKKIDHLATLWCEYIEMELRHKNFQNARNLALRATAVPPNPKKIPRDAPTTQRLFKSIRLWGLYTDLEESFGTFLTTKSAYEKILDLRVATPATILNYAKFLEENSHFEEAFKVYERGISVFKYPAALEVWITYIRKFVERYGGAKMERLRDLFEQAVGEVPSEFSHVIYLLYAEMEETYGLARHAMLIHDRATKAVSKELKTAMFNIYIRKATESFGVTRTRQIFEKAIEYLPEEELRTFALRYATLERRLGEIDRARAIYVHTAQYCPPVTVFQFWEVWRLFEVKHGNVDTVREMFRIKRSVAAQYNTGINQTLMQNAKSGGLEPVDDMKKLEQEQMEAEQNEPRKEPVFFGPENLPEDQLQPQERIKLKNLDEIDLDEEEEEAEKEEDVLLQTITHSKRNQNTKKQYKSDDESNEEEEPQDEDEEEEEEDVEIQQKSVPRAVFGSAADKVEELKKEKKQKK